MTLGDRGDSFFCYRQPGGLHFSYTSHAEPFALESTSRPVLLHQVQAATADWHQLVRSIVSVADLSRSSLAATTTESDKADPRWQRLADRGRSAPP
jgi:hypothetical protein